MASGTSIGGVTGFIEVEDDFSAAFDQAHARLTGFSSAFLNAGRAMSIAGTALTAGITVPIVAGLGSAIESAVSFESAFANVAKVLNPSVEQTKEWTTAIREMATEIPKTREELSKIAAIGGQFGISKEGILDFTRSVAMLDTAIDGISGEQAAAGLAQVSKITGVAEKDFLRLADVLVDLGNKGSSTEAVILEFARRLSGAGTTVGLTAQEIFGVGAAMANLGINAEAGGSAFSRVMMDIDKAVARNSEKLADFARVAQVSAEEFAARWKASPVQALELFFTGLGTAEERGLNLNLVLDELGMNAIRVGDVTRRLAHAQGEFTTQVNNATTAWDQNKATMEEFGVKAATTESQWVMLNSAISDVALEIGNVIVPVLKSLMELMKPIIDQAKKWAEAFTQLPKPIQAVAFGIAAIAAALPLLLLFAGQLVFVIGALTGNMVRATAATLANTPVTIANTVAKEMNVAATLTQASALNTFSVSATRAIIPGTAWTYTTTAAATASTQAATSTGILSGALGILRGAFAALLTPIGLIVAAIAGMAIAWANFKDDWTRAFDVLLPPLGFFREGMDQTKKALKDNEVVIKDVSTILKNEFKNAVSDASDWVKDLARSIRDGLNPAMMDAKSLIGIFAFAIFEHAPQLQAYAFSVDIVAQAYEKARLELDAWRIALHLAAEKQREWDNRHAKQRTTDIKLPTEDFFQGPKIDPADLAKLGGMKAHLAEVRLMVRDLTAEQRSQIDAGIELKMTNDEIVSSMKNLFPSIKLTADAVVLYKDSIKDAAKESKEAVHDMKALEKANEQLAAAHQKSINLAKKNSMDFNKLMEDQAKIRNEAIFEAVKLQIDSEKELDKITREGLMSRANFQLQQLDRQQQSIMKGLDLTTDAGARAAMALDALTAKQKLDIITQDELDQWVLFANLITDAKLRMEQLAHTQKMDMFNSIGDMFTQISQLTQGKGAFFGSSIADANAELTELRANGASTAEILNAQKKVTRAWATELFQSAGAITAGLKQSYEATQMLDKNGVKLGGNFGLLSHVFNDNASKSQKMAAGFASAAHIAQGAMNVWSATSAHKSRGGNALGGMMAGAQAGAAFGPYGIAIGAAAGLVVGLLRGKPEWAKAAEEVGRDFGVEISDALAKEIEKSSKELFKKDRSAANLFHLKDIIDEGGGLNEKNLDQMTGKLRDVFSMLEMGKFNMEQATKVIEENWQAFAEAGTSATGRLSIGLREVIKLQRQVGMESKQIAEYLKGQSKIASDGFNMTVDAASSAFENWSNIGKRVSDARDIFAKAIENMGADERQALMDGMKDFKGTAADFLREQAELYKTAQEGDPRLKTWLSGATLKFLEVEKAEEKWAEGTRLQGEAAAKAKGELQDLGVIALATFNAAIKSGSDYFTALKTIQPGIQQLREAYANLGMDVENSALKQLFLQETIATKNPQLITGVQGLTQSFIALGNMGMLTTDTFAAMQRTGMEMYVRLQDAVSQAGGSTRDALLPMQQYLQEAAAEAKALGIPLDDNTQMLIDQSVELGIWKEVGPSAMESMTEATKALSVVMGEVRDAILGLGPAAETAAGRARAAFEGMAGSIVDGADAVHTFEYGSSPGGLVDIPPLAADAQQAIIKMALQAQELERVLQSRELQLPVLNTMPVGPRVKLEEVVEDTPWTASIAVETMVQRKTLDTTLSDIERERIVDIKLQLEKQALERPLQKLEAISTGFISDEAQQAAQLLQNQKIKALTEQMSFVKGMSFDLADTGISEELQKQAAVANGSFLTVNDAIARAQQTAAKYGATLSALDLASLGDRFGQREGLFNTDDVTRFLTELDKLHSAQGSVADEMQRQAQELQNQQIRSLTKQMSFTKSMGFDLADIGISAELQKEAAVANGSFLTVNDAIARAQQTAAKYGATLSDMDLASLGDRFGQREGLFKTDDVTKFLTELERVQATAQGATAGAAGSFQKLQSAVQATERDVNAVSYGRSPGGLIAIPALAQAASASISSFAMRSQSEVSRLGNEITGLPTFKINTSPDMLADAHAQFRIASSALDQMNEQVAQPRIEFRPIDPALLDKMSGWVTPLELKVNPDALDGTARDVEALWKHLQQRQNELLNDSFATWSGGLDEIPANIQEIIDRMNGIPKIVPNPFEDWPLIEEYYDPRMPQVDPGALTGRPNPSERQELPTPVTASNGYVAGTASNNVSPGGYSDREFEHAGSGETVGTKEVVSNNYWGGVIVIDDPRKVDQAYQTMISRFPNDAMTGDVRATLHRIIDQRVPEELVKLGVIQ